MTQPVERSSPMPAWAQVFRDLRTRIDSGELPIGERLAPEVDLASTYRVSRITVRQALAKLADDGYVDRRQGTGTFVKERLTPVQHDLSLHEHWRHRASAAGQLPASEVLEIGAPPVPPMAIADLIQSSAWNLTSLVYLQRRQLIDHQPIGVSESWMPRELVPDIAEKGLDEGSLSLTLRRRYNIKRIEVRNRLEVGLASATESRILTCYPDAPVFIVTAVSLIAQQQVLEISRTTWLGSRVGFNYTRMSADS